MTQPRSKEFYDCIGCSDFWKPLDLYRSVQLPYHYECTKVYY